MHKAPLLFFAIYLVSCNGNQKQQAIVSIQSENAGSDYFLSLLKSAEIENKKLFLVFGAPGCRWCKAFKKYHDDPGVSNVLNRYFIIADINYNSTPGGKELFKKYSKIGMPSWSIIDWDESVIVDSDNSGTGHGNIGYPNKEEEISYYLGSLKLAVPDITQSECEILMYKLKYYK